jgi:hypothetical protein
MKTCREIYERGNHFMSFHEMQKAHLKICNQFHYIVDTSQNKSDELVDAILSKLDKDKKNFENDFGYRFKYS